MNILLVNDDGIHANGILELAKALHKDHNVLVSAPDKERSGAGHAITIGDPLRMNSVNLNGLPDVPAYSVSGTPADCVKLAIGNSGFSPDLVISGINHGGNLGSDVLYSGTVSAALEAFSMGYPAIAASVNSFFNAKMQDAAKVVAQLVNSLYEYCGDCIKVFNLNIPNLSYDEIKGVKITQLGSQQYCAKYTERTDPFNRKYYWLPIELITITDSERDTDERWVKDGYVTITPLKVDLTDRELLVKMQQNDWSNLI